MFGKPMIKAITAIVAGTMFFLAGACCINADEAVTAQIPVYGNAVKAGAVELGELVYTVSDVREFMEGMGKKAADGNRLLCINMIVENKGTEERQMTSTMVFRLSDDSGGLYNVLLPEGLDSINGIIPPKAAVKGNIWFEVPQRESSFRLNIRHTPTEMQTFFSGIRLNGVAASTVAVTGEKTAGDCADSRALYIPGNEISVDDMVFTFKGISISNNGTEDNAVKLLNIQLAVKNKGNKEEQLTSIMTFRLMGHDGSTYSLYYPQCHGVDGILKPGDELCGSLVYRINKDERALTLEIKPWTYKPVKGIVDIKVGE